MRRAIVWFFNPPTWWRWFSLGYLAHYALDALNLRVTIL